MRYFPLNGNLPLEGLSGKHQRHELWLEGSGGGGAVLRERGGGGGSFYFQL